MDIKSLKPTIVLVHGAVEDSSLWTHGVSSGSSARAIRSRSSPIPCVAWLTTLPTCVVCWTRSRGP